MTIKTWHDRIMELEDGVIVTEPHVTRYMQAEIDELRAAVKSLAKDAEARDWQPIETAPKDGTAVLVSPGTWSDRSASIAKWKSDKYAKKPRPYWSRDDDLGRVTLSRERQTTHWMPLPPPPQDKDKRATGESS